MIKCSKVADAIIPSAVDFKSTNGSFLGMLITIMGFSITIRNILISRETSKYKNFSTKRIIANSSNYLSLVLWYIILISSLYGIVLYVLGYQRQIVILVITSIISMLIYFWLTLHRLKDNQVQKILAELILNDLLCENHVTYRRDLLKKLCLLDDLNTSINDSYIVFNLFLKSLRTLSIKKCITPLSYTIKNINIRILRKGRRKDKLFIEQKLKKSYYYSLDFFTDFIAENQKHNTEFLVEYITNMLLQCDELILDTGNFIGNHRKNNTFYLFFNTVYGLIQSCFQNMDFENVVHILDDYINHLKENKSGIAIIVDYIIALIVLCIDYLLCNEKLYRNTEIWRILDYYDKLSSKITEYELGFICDVVIDDIAIKRVLEEIRERYKNQSTTHIPIYFD